MSVQIIYVIQICFTMKKTLVTFLFLLFLGQSYAQIAQWIIPPMYDSIYFANTANLIITDSVDSKVFWNRNGQRLFKATGTVNPFSEGYAVLTNDTSAIVGIYDIKGNYTSLSEYQIKVANEFPYFTDGNLIIRKKKGYYMIDSEGYIYKTRHVKLYPFHNGYAVCQDFENPQKRKGTVRYLMDKNRNEVSLICKGSTFDPVDVDFISSVNDEQIAVVVIKNMLYLFDGNTRRLSPLYFPNDNSKHPTQAKLEGDIPSTDNSSPVIYARCGKTDQITIFFDNYLVPTDIYYNNEKYHYTQKSDTREEMSTQLQAFKEDRLFGLSWNGKNAIPAQFENICCCHDNKAFAKQSGKQGMLQVIENATLNLTINNGKNIAFRHQEYESTIQIDMPSTLNPSKIDIKVDPDSGCIIDKISKQTKKSDFGNRAEYTCRLTIPSSITEDPSEYDYLIQMTYDNILITPQHIKVKAWREMFYDVIVNDAEKGIDKKNGLLTFPYTIDTERQPNEEAVHFDLDVLPDSMEVDIEKTSTTRGICRIPLSVLEDGENYLFFKLTEQGCPPISFPYSITYNKPASKSKQKASVKTDYVIEKTTMQEIENKN